MGDLNFFLRNAASEERLLELFERETGLACESMDHLKEQAVALLTSTSYDEGFRFGISLCWPQHLGTAKTLVQLAKALAADLKEEVLFESERSVSDSAAEEWLLVSPYDADARVVKIVELQNGVDLAAHA